jgi:indolepyruvate ferredoxin oxidoreductase beta subunit
VVSAALFGALAGSGALPFARAEFEGAVRRGGVGVEPSLAAFARGHDAAVAAAAGADTAAATAAAAPAGAPGPGPGAGAAPGAGVVATPLPAQAPLDIPTQASTDARASQARRAASAPPELGPALARVGARIESEFPPAAHAMLRHAVVRWADWQDVRHADEMLSRLAPVRDVDARCGDGSWTLLDETARHLALWATYEDAVRVADLKTRSGRFERVRRETRRGESQVLEINDTCTRGSRRSPTRCRRVSGDACSPTRTPGRSSGGPSRAAARCASPRCRASCR